MKKFYTLTIIFTLMFSCLLGYSQTEPKKTQKKEQKIEITETGKLVIAGKEVNLTPEQIYAIDTTLANKLGITDSIAKAKADSLANIAIKQQKAVIDNPDSTKTEKTVATILAALLTLLGFVSKMFAGKQFNGEILKRFFGETPKFWKKIMWISAISLFLFLCLIGINTFLVPFLSNAFESICYYMITISFTAWGLAKLTLKNPELPEPNEPKI